MSDLRCFNCLLDPDASGHGAVTMVQGTAYCADHARYLAKMEDIKYVDPDDEEELSR